jgi:phospholipase/carboxylesterase
MNNTQFADPPIELETAPNPTLSVIWMHGLGADGNDFPPIVPELRLPKEPGIRFIFPHAPMMPITGNGGHVMRAWFDIRSFSGGSRDVDQASVLDSCELIRGLIAQENARGIPSHRIVLAGFSQGGAMTYTVGLTHPERLGGMIVLSGYMPAPEWVEQHASAANRETPIFAVHGSHDEVLPLRLGTAARDLAMRLNTALDWHEYPMPHTLCMEEVQALGAWLQQRARE